MYRIPETANALVLRTDFSDEKAWENLRAVLGQVHHDVFLANLSYLSDPDLAGVQPEDIPLLIQPESRHTFMFLADETTFSHPDMPLLAVDLFDEGTMTFRSAASSVGCVENNLSLGNSDFEEFRDTVDADGIFRFSWPD
jgi:hypothetical protein